MSKSNDPKKIDQLMKEFGFNTDAAPSTARALILNLVRSAYGPDAAREFMRQMNLSENHVDKTEDKKEQFEKSSVIISESGERQLRLFDDTGTD